MKNKHALKILSLSFLTVSLLSSCKGKPGIQGKLGEKGPVGPKGEVGTKGDKGSSYLPIITLNNSVSNGIIRQDKYFIEPGESFKLYFIPNTGYQLLYSVNINGEEVINEDPTSLVMEFNSSDEDKGYQILNASFITYDEYKYKLVNSFYDKLFTKDKGLASIKYKLDEDKFYIDEVGYGDYANSDIANKTINLYKKLNELDLSSDLDLSSKVKAIKEVFDKESDSIYKDYYESIKEAKAKVEKYIKNRLYPLIPEGKNVIDPLEGNYRSFMTNSERTKNLIIAKSKLKKVGTLEGLNNFFQISEPDFSSMVGSLNLLEYHRMNIIKNLFNIEEKIFKINPDLKWRANNDSLSMDDPEEGVTPVEVEDNNKKSLNKYTSFMKSFTKQGIKFDNLPYDYTTNLLRMLFNETEVKTFLDIDKDLNYYSNFEKDLVKMYQSFVKTLLIKEIDIFKTRIDESNSFESQYAKENCLGQIETVITKWFLENATDLNSTTPFEYSKYINFTKDGWYKEVEKLLKDKYLSFYKELIGNLRLEAKEKLDNKLIDVLGSDSVYNELLLDKDSKLNTDNTLKKDCNAINKHKQLVDEVMNPNSTKYKDFKTIKKINTGEITGCRTNAIKKHYLKEVIKLKNYDNEEFSYISNYNSSKKTVTLTPNYKNKLVKNSSNYITLSSTKHIKGDENYFKDAIRRMYSGTVKGVGPLISTQPTLTKIKDYNIELQNIYNNLVEFNKDYIDYCNDMKTKDELYVNAYLNNENSNEFKLIDSFKKKLCNFEKVDNKESLKSIKDEYQNTLNYLVKEMPTMLEEIYKAKLNAIATDPNIINKLMISRQVKETYLEYFNKVNIIEGVEKDYSSMVTNYFKWLNDASNAISAVL